MRTGTETAGDVRGGVQVAGLEGHVSRSAVYLVHEEVSGRRRADEWRMNPPGVFLRKRMLSQAECERPVTGGTTVRGHGCCGV